MDNLSELATAAGPQDLPKFGSPGTNKRPAVQKRCPLFGNLDVSFCSIQMALQRRFEYPLDTLLTLYFSRLPLGDIHQALLNDPHMTQ
jgi:hypothetical protein